MTAANSTLNTLHSSLKTRYFSLFTILALAACSADDCYEISDFVGNDTLTVTFNGPEVVVGEVPYFVSVSTDGAHVVVNRSEEHTSELQSPDHPLRPGCQQSVWQGTSPDALRRHCQHPDRRHRLCHVVCQYHGRYHPAEGDPLQRGTDILPGRGYAQRCGKRTERHCQRRLYHH